MINPFVIRKWAAIIVPQLLSVITFFVLVTIYNIWYGLGGFFIALLVGGLLGNVLLKNPFSLLIEGKGILAIDINSTGVLRPFIVGVEAPYIKGKVLGKKLKDVFNRSAVQNLAVPKKAGKATMKEDGGLTINLTEEEYNQGRMATFHYPTLLYNSQIDSIITKDWLSDKEKDLFSEHTILYLNRQIEDLSSHVRDFGRAVVENLRPQGNFLQSKWTWIIIFVAIVIMVVLFAPAILNAVSGFTSGAGTAVSTASGGTAGGSAVIPR